MLIFPFAKTLCSTTALNLDLSATSLHARSTIKLRCLVDAFLFWQRSFQALKCNLHRINCALYRILHITWNTRYFTFVSYMNAAVSCFNFSSRLPFCILQNRLQEYIAFVKPGTVLELWRTGDATVDCNLNDSKETRSSLLRCSLALVTTRYV